MEIEYLEKIVLDQALDFANQSSSIDRTIDYLSHTTLKEVTVISGVRRCGKSTLLSHIAKTLSPASTIFYINFEDPRLKTFVAEDFEVLYKLWASRVARESNREIAIFIDEVQNITGWERWITFFSRKHLHKVFVTGSNSKLLSSELSTFLTGRHLDLHLTPLSFKEIIEDQVKRVGLNGTALDIEQERLFEKFSLYGGFPRPFLDTAFNYLSVYYEDIVVRDIIVRNKVRNKNALISLSRLLASETTRLFSHSKTAKLLGLKDEASVRKYCKFFLDSFLYHELRCFSASIRNQIRSQPRYFSVDHALARVNGLWKVDDPGRILELIVCNELKRRGDNIFYWRSKKNFEIDFLSVRGNDPHIAIQICYSLTEPTTYERETRALLAAHNELGVGKLMIISRYEKLDLRVEGVEIEVVPIIEWLLKI